MILETHHILILPSLRLLLLSILQMIKIYGDEEGRGGSRGIVNNIIDDFCIPCVVPRTQLRGYELMST